MTNKLNSFDIANEIIASCISDPETILFDHNDGDLLKAIDYLMEEAVTTFELELPADTLTIRARLRAWLGAAAVAHQGN